MLINYKYFKEMNEKLRLNLDDIIEFANNDKMKYKKDKKETFVKQKYGSTKVDVVSFFNKYTLSSYGDKIELVIHGHKNFYCVNKCSLKLSAIFTIFIFLFKILSKKEIDMNIYKYIVKYEYCKHCYIDELEHGYFNDEKQYFYKGLLLN